MNISLKTFCAKFFTKIAAKDRNGFSGARRGAQLGAVQTSPHFFSAFAVHAMLGILMTDVSLFTVMSTTVVELTL